MTRPLTTLLAAIGISAAGLAAIPAVLAQAIGARR